MLHVIVMVGAILCAILAIRTSRLLHAALWLAGASALVALMLYLLGAAEVAVVELSVGAGLVTVLFVFAINIAGEEAVTLKSLVPRPLALLLIVVSLVLLSLLSLPQLGIRLAIYESKTFAEVLWQDRALDVLVQIILIFTGVLGLLGFIANGQPEPDEPVEEVR